MALGGLLKGVAADMAVLAWGGKRKWLGIGRS